MTKKHFIKIAENIRIDYKFANAAERLAIKNVVETSLCPVFAEINSRFDREKFLDACFYGLGEQAPDRKPERWDGEHEGYGSCGVLGCDCS